MHIPYNGGAPSQLAMLSGTVDFTLDNLATSGANIRAGKVIPLAVTTARRSALLPVVPTMAETYPGFEIDTWWGLIAPAATPRDVVARLNQAFVAALESPDIKTKFAGMMAEPVPTTPEQFADLMKREYVRYEGVVKASGATWAAASTAAASSGKVTTMVVVLPNAGLGHSNLIFPVRASDSAGAGPSPRSRR